MHLHIISRADAKRTGLKYYFTGKPCKHGHVSLRYVSMGACFACTIDGYYQNRDERLAVAKQYREKNYEIVRAKDRKYKQENRDAMNASRREKYKKDNSVEIARVVAYQAANKAKVSERRRKHYASNAERLRRYTREYNKLNPATARKNNMLRRARKAGADGFYTVHDVRRILVDQKYKCANCMCDVSEKYHVDHIMPLKLGGTNWPSNLQMLCPTCNMRKSAKHPIDWAQENGRLL